ncbi:lantibiotic dehydratase [Streptomyces sioyaensis]|uniref:lantibiotic dehydratase n=1 Tax=Streptomyces sioyaensis TaxID=67364 RepID=UPI0037D6B21D
MHRHCSVAHSQPSRTAFRGNLRRHHGGGGRRGRKSLEFLHALAGDRLLREAVEISSPPLARRWDEILRGRSAASPTSGGPSARSSSYQLRMATRCTPFGIMAGVAVARFADTAGDACARLGAAHRKSVRLERGWVTALTPPGPVVRKCSPSSGSRPTTCAGYAATGWCSPMSRIWGSRTPAR